MGFLEVLGLRKTPSSIITRHGPRAVNKRLQAPERWESIQALLALKSPEAIEALLPRFMFHVEPSVSDHDEKEAIFEAVISLGPEIRPALERFLKQSDSLSWPLRMLQAVSKDEDVIHAVLNVLDGMDTEYMRDPEKKLQILAFLEERDETFMAPKVLRFVQDVNETARFHAAGVLIRQADPAPYLSDLVNAFCHEESMRLRTRLADFFAQNQIKLSLSAEQQQPFVAKLPLGYTLSKDNLVLKTQ